MNFQMDDFSGFILLEDKKHKVMSIISRYEFSSAICAAFAITSWRNNRGAQESCLALNAAIADNEIWGNKIIGTYADLIEFFNLLYSILQITSYDDPVLMDFGEIKLNYQSRYYSIITGTGHTASIFAALQFLESLSNHSHMDTFTLELLNYSDNMLRQLHDANASIDIDYSVDARFECPSLNYFETVKSFLGNKTWENLNHTLIRMLSTEGNTIAKSHFLRFNGTYYPLFNPSLIIDYFTNILSNCSQNEIGNVIKEALSTKLERIYGGGRIHANPIIRNCLLLNGDRPLSKNSLCFVAQEGENLVIFLDYNTNYLHTVQDIQTAFNGNSLSVADLDNRLSPSICKAYQIKNECNLFIICYGEHLNVDEPTIQLRGRTEKRVYSPIDLMFMIMFSESIRQIIEFDSYEENEDTQVFSWGGLSDYYTLYLHEKGYVSKGAVEYSSIYSGIDTAAAHIFSKYLVLNKNFPFHTSSRIFNSPECWIVEIDDNGIFQYATKSKELIGGALLTHDNGCTVFLSYDFYNILKDLNSTQVKLSIDLFRGIVERFFKEFEEEFSAICFLTNSFLQLKCLSLSNQNDVDRYIVQRSFLNRERCMTIEFEVNYKKLMNDISEASDRMVEYCMVRELLEPIFSLSEADCTELLEKLEIRAYEKKTVDTTSLKLEYYFNPNTYIIKESDISQLSTRKQIAKICADAGVVPGIYAKKDATAIVRKIQENVVRCLEEKIVSFSRNNLHNILLSALASEQFSINVNGISASMGTNIDDNERVRSQEKAFQASERSKIIKMSFIYLLETNLFLKDGRGEEVADKNKLSELLSFAEWLVYLQNSSDLCFHTDSKTELVVLDDYRIDVELGEDYSRIAETDSKRRLYSEPYELKGDETDRLYFEKVVEAFYKDTGVNFRVFESVLHQLSESSFPTDSVQFKEITPNVLRVNASDAIKDCLTFVVEEISVEDVQKAYDFLTISPGLLKSIDGKCHPILPIWEREKRDNCFVVKPLCLFEGDYVFSPIMAEELRRRWTSGLLQFYPPYEIGLENTIIAIANWKNYYEHLFSSDVENLLKSYGCEYCKHDVDLRREDRKSNHPTIDVLGDYDVIGLSLSRKKIFVIECKVLQPIGSVFEHSNQQKRFFIEEKYDEKFQKRIDYFTSVAFSFFSNIGYKITDEFQIQPYMVVNKVFSSYYKPVSFPIVTYGELKAELEQDGI